MPSSQQHQLTYEMTTTQQPPSYESLSAVKAPPTYDAPPTNERLPTILTHLLTSSEGAQLPTMHQSLATSAAVFVPDVVLLSGHGSAVTQSVTNNSVSLPQPQFELRPQAQLQPDITSQSVADFIALTSGRFVSAVSAFVTKFYNIVIIQHINMLCYCTVQLVLSAVKLR